MRNEDIVEMVQDRAERRRVMADTIYKLKFETEGIDEATEQIEALVEAYDGFPPQVQIKGCHDCTITIYPSQTKFFETKADDEPQTDCAWK